MQKASSRFSSSPRRRLVDFLQNRRIVGASTWRKRGLVRKRRLVDGVVVRGGPGLQG